MSPVQSPLQLTQSKFSSQASSYMNLNGSKNLERNYMFQSYGTYSQKTADEIATLGRCLVTDIITPAHIYPACVQT